MLKNMVIGNRQKDAIMTKEYSNEFNTVTVEKIVVLMEEVAVLESRYEDHNTGNLRTAVNVLRSRVEELKGKIDKPISKEDIRITDISRILGCAKSHAINLKAVLNADDEIKHLISTDKVKSLEKAAVLCNIESVELRSIAINDVLEGGSLKHLKSLLKKDKGKLEKVIKSVSQVRHPDATHYDAAE